MRLSLIFLEDDKASICCRISELIVLNARDSSPISSLEFTGGVWVYSPCDTLSACVCNCLNGSVILEDKKNAKTVVIARKITAIIRIMTVIALFVSSILFKS